MTHRPSPRFPCHGFLLLALWALPLLGAETAPEPKREFRGAWVATVYNLDWPSKPGLPAPQQRGELIALLDRAAALKLNAIVLQVRPACDALYASKLEPWSAYLTGRMGVAPVPNYDPLEFAVAAAHERGLELHAWFNPFRALSNVNQETSPGHVSKRHPEWVRRYANQLWLDPGEPGAREHALNVILDVVRRYDIDGVHIDDYFYPYPVKHLGTPVPFPDDASAARHGGSGDRATWRRANIDDLVSKLYRGIKAEKRWVKFGISPFGIWRPGVPATIEAGLDSYAHLYADSRKWLNEGWCDYFTPQLYWSIQPAKQSFPTLLDWWRSQNKQGRHLWPGIATDRVGPTRLANEIENQILLSRQGDTHPGHIHWSLRALTRNKGGVADLLARKAYSEPALVPASPWLGPGRPDRPRAGRLGDEIRFSAAGETPRWWIVQSRKGSRWETQILPGDHTRAAAAGADDVSVRAVDRAGTVSEPGRAAAVVRQASNLPPDV